MTTATLIALLGFAFASSITPGPNNMMLFASGVNFGFRRTIPHMIGIGIGFFVLLVAVGLGLGALFKAQPMLHLALKVFGGAYLVWIAWKIGNTHEMGEAKSSAAPMTFLAAAAFQWVNPKGWVMAIGGMAAYADTDNLIGSVLLVATVFAIVNVPCVSLWAGFGSVLREWLSVHPRLKWFNKSMAILLIASLWPLLK